MWADSPLPVPAFSMDRVARRKAKKAAASSSSAAAPLLPPPRPPPPFVAAASPSSFGDGSNITSLLEPAIDGPPSPGRIRALSNQMKRTSFLEKHQSQLTTSSGSSSLRSLASGDRPSWEHALEGMALSRKSSGRSTTSSSVQPRERPESVQIFGKTFFNRRGKLRRENSAPSSSGSSLYSNEMPFDVPTSAPGNRDTLFPSFLGRRRTPKPDAIIEESEVRRRFQISGPYNFQHLTHTERDHVPALQRASRVAPRPDNLYFPDFSSEALPLVEDEADGNPLGLFPPSALRQQPSPPRMGLKHARSQDQLRMPPPRPPRSPPLGPLLVSPPVPPPRMSSRISGRYDGFNPTGSTFRERPQTSGGFRRPPPLALSSASPTLGPGHGRAYSCSAKVEAPPEHRYSRPTRAAPDDANWPLPCPQTCPPTALFDKALPDVPEEEEHLPMPRRSRISIASNNSSLRGSQSVPVLRQLAQSQGSSSQRPPSGASDTLGRFDLFAAQRALRAAMSDGEMSDCPPRDSWEDDIDYCYEHAVEADCEYAWERPSLDADREDGDAAPDADGTCSPGDGVSPPMLTPARFDVPALSPASLGSAASALEAITPTAAAAPASNFSLPRTEAPGSRRFLHARTASHASSFKESHGFTLSPSLLIPGSDYHRAMMAHGADEHPAHADFPAYEEPALAMDGSIVFGQARMSASTTASSESRDNSGSDRHISTASTATDLTRLTMSTASIEDLTPKDELDCAPEVQLPRASRARGKSEPMAFLMEEPESPVLRRHFPRSHSDPKLANMKKAGDEPNKLVKRKDSFSLRRQRSRTTSLSTPPPPQYGLFPSVSLAATRT